MKKNTLKKIAGIATATVMAVSTAAVTAVTASAMGPNNNRTTVTFEPCGNWREAGAKMSAHFFNSQNGNKTTIELKENGSKLYTEAPVGYDKVVFLRQSPAGEIWNQTYDLTIMPNETFKATGFEGKYYVGEWQAKKETKQLFLNVSKEWKEANARFMAFVYNDTNGDKQWLGLNKVSDDNYFVNVSADYTHVVFVRLPANATDDFDQAWNKTCNIRIDKLNNCYFVNGWELDKNADGNDAYWS